MSTNILGHAAPPLHAQKYELHSGNLSAWTKMCIALVLICIALAVAVRAINVARSGANTIDIGAVKLAGDLFRNLTSDTAVPRTTQHKRMPGLALLLTAAAVVDTRVRQGLACGITDRTHCRPELFASVLAAQVMAAVAALGMLLIIAWRLSGSWEIALITLVLTFVATRPGEAAGQVNAMIWYQFLLTLSLFLAVLAQRRSAALALGAGMALGASALFEPTTAVIIPVAAVLFLLSGSDRSERRSVQMLCAASFMSGALLSLAVFFAAENLSYDTNAVLGHLARHAAERVAFHSMDATTWVQSLIVPIPLVGDWLRELLGPAATKFGMSRPGSIFLEGPAKIYPDSVANSASAFGSVMWIVREKILGEIGAYTASAPSLICRGLWAGGGVIALFGVFHVRRMLAYARADQRITDHLVVLVPIAALFVVNSLLTSNGYWLNPLLPFVYSYAIAYVASGL